MPPSTSTTPWLNLFALLVTLLLTHVLYSESVQPARLARKIGDRAYRRAAVYRLLASVAMLLHVVAMVVYYFYPLPIGLPRSFGWGWLVSIVMAAVIALPSAYLMLRGARDAGKETMTPDPNHKMYGGIYEKVRHPQAIGEYPLWIVIALLLNSPFLVLFSLLWLPVFVSWCYIEERDLVLRYGEPYREYQRRVGMFFPKRRGAQPYRPG
jgi:protein-S-isoprenylcysteine O-methyltransferase Ste14